MNGDWILTFSGKKFYPLDPRPEDICIEDIAHALSNCCRYNGHCKKFYSVAEHCARMARTKTIPGSPKWKLMHDAAEAYVSDVPSPIKPMLSEFKNIENNILSVIAEKFNLGFYEHSSIKNADLIMLATEKRDILVSGPMWKLDLPEPLETIIYPWTPEVSEDLFLNTAKEFGIV